MIDWFKRTFFKPHTVYPLFPFAGKMKAKDPELYASVGHMLILEGIDVWRKRYPEDFTDLNASIEDPNVIR